MLNRFIVLFDHNYDVQGQGWQQTRSLLTIGGGGFWGQGYLHGTQSQAGVGSVPARHTDLIFAVIGEELGFVGATLAILLLVAIIIRVLMVGRRAAQPFHTYVCVGIASMVMFQMIINIGMCLFIMPVIGLTLPFFSYGGSSVVTLFAAMGFVSGIKKRTCGPPSGTALRRPTRYIDFKATPSNENRGARRSGFFHLCSVRIFSVLSTTLPLYQYGISELTGGFIMNIRMKRGTALCLTASLLLAGSAQALFGLGKSKPETVSPENGPTARDLEIRTYRGIPYLGQLEAADPDGGS
ncbi:MAG: FtsW/RodA/SpoVE family cell cycle protein [Dysosmobacter sp.]